MYEFLVPNTCTWFNFVLEQARGNSEIAQVHRNIRGTLRCLYALATPAQNRRLEDPSDDSYGCASSPGFQLLPGGRTDTILGRRTIVGSRRRGPRCRVRRTPFDNEFQGRSSDTGRETDGWDCSFREFPLDWQEQSGTVECLRLDSKAREGIRPSSCNLGMLGVCGTEVKIYETPWVAPWTPASILSRLCWQCLNQR